MTSQSIGQEMEKLAGDYLQQQGLTTLTRNYHCRYGEIDLIMQDGNTLVFVEVRYRRNSRYGSALESVDIRKQQRLITTANHYLQKTKLSSHACRFDVIAIHMTTAPEITWIKDAFQTH